MLNEVQLEGEAVTYIKDALSQGGTLSNYLLNLPFHRGQVRTWLPAAVDPTRVTAFNMGGVITGEVRVKVDLKLGEFISSYLSQSGTRYAIFEHAWAKASDPFLLSKSSKFFICESQVYFFLTSEDRDVMEILDAVKSASTYLFTGILANVPDALQIRDHQEITQEILRKFADKTEHLIVGAYDDEGKLIWSRH